ncbi:unnamed protein product [Cylindrotheca closterium]|uniref:ABM domain-containing protein n=1 Tax=Cylindrotheca closterium TaxID=2856 RepID=A0AAD2JGL5_9STRA|nr:unnamed protein product [Cylindrotheca closterium]
MMTEGEDIEGPQKGQILERRHYAEGAAEHHSQGGAQNLTIFAKHKVVRGKESQFQQWAREINDVQSRFEGYQGAETIRPTTCKSNEYVNIFRFDNYEHLQLWMDSKERQQLLERTNEFDEAPIETSYHSLEYWFVQDQKGKEPASGPPSDEKMVVVTFLLIWVQVHFLGPAFGGLDIPFLLAEALTVLAVVVLTTYILMPVTTKYLLNWWLFPKPNKVWYCFDKKEKEDGVVPQSQNLVQKHSKTTTNSSLDNGTSREFAFKCPDATDQQEVEEV